MQSRDWRVGFGFIGLSSVLLGLFGLMAYGVSEAMPLDVVVDDYGITFGGAAVRWGDIDRFEHIAPGVGYGAGMHEILVRTTSGAMTLGPGPAKAVDELARVIAARIRGRA